VQEEWGVASEIFFRKQRISRDAKCGLTKGVRAERPINPIFRPSSNWLRLSNSSLEKNAEDRSGAISNEEPCLNACKTDHTYRVMAA
jgi:hypothetical protein